ncbi:ORF6N domain-containing protein [Desulfonatronum thioautotrophicum]|uniref:ORF6N domain-containing protein n=1 Tax=Desulfonatronum thioautotrophicum TaxID=617001 RepID=UPI000AC984AB
MKAIRLREQIKRNIIRFPEDFMFQLKEIEVDHLVSQNAIPSRKNLGGALPYGSKRLSSFQSILPQTRKADKSRTSGLTHVL